ncbi:hypothetical protein BV372_00510 [Nostoc sp. T09]|uniref:hypothetical protein n=1 Tax=Nostoc sp. T09 TaxID=1932621 RepID=UPI000A39FE26|nr:hypothetical protein [Nostoc sp. T09]OUL37483.1 hypothetical protein BV372_00510 [Nostoc sp. T09]
MPVPDSSDSSAFESQAKSKLKQESTYTHRFAWFEELRFWLSVLIGFALMIGYKVIFSIRSTVIDIGVVGLVSLIVALMAGFPIHQAIVSFIRVLFESGGISQ